MGIYSVDHSNAICIYLKCIHLGYMVLHPFTDIGIYTKHGLCCAYSCVPYDCNLHMCKIYRFYTYGVAPLQNSLVYT